jgi:enoyl-CoA hydratase/carnithine racemase
VRALLAIERCWQSKEIKMSTSIGGAKPPHHVSHACADETTQRFRTPRLDFANFKPRHFVWELEGKVATVTLNRPERKNPLTFESYGELRDTFRDLIYAETIKSVVITGAGGNFCSGGDVHEIIGPLVEMQRNGDTAGLLAFTRMTGDLVKAMRACPQPIVAAVDGICAGAGAILAMASDLRLGTARSKVAFLFVRVGLAGADMGACNMLPRIIGAGRAAELLYTGRSMDGGEAERWGFYNRLCEPEAVLTEAQALAKTLADGPTFAHAMTKRCIHQEWSMGIEEAIEAEAQAQAICMQTKDYERAYDAFMRKEKPDFLGT